MSPQECMIVDVVILFLLGTALGSFANVVITRYPAGSLLGRSRCPTCGKKLRWWELIPLLSFVVVRGSCNRCKAPIAVQYPLVELFMGCVMLIVFLPLPTTLSAILAAMLSVIIIETLVILFYIDVRLLLLPDRFIFIVAGAAMLLLVMRGNSATAALWGVGIGAGFLLVVWLFTAGRGIGLGDIKLMLPLGALLGPTATMVMLLVAFTSGALCGLYLLATRQATLKTPLPFGPYLIAAAGIVTLMPQLPAYLFRWIEG